MCSFYLLLDTACCFLSSLSCGSWRESFCRSVFWNGFFCTHWNHSNKYQGSLLKHCKCSAATVHFKVIYPWHLIYNCLGYLIWNGCWVVWDCYSLKLIMFLSGSTGIRTMWACWRMAQRCPHTTPKALCSWERSLWVTQLWIPSILSTSLHGWVMN